MEGSEIRELVKKLVADEVARMAIGQQLPVTTGVVSVIQSDGTMDVITPGGTLTGLTTPREIVPVKQEQVIVISAGGRYIVL